MSRKPTMNTQVPVSGSTAKRRKPTRTATSSYSFAGFSMPSASSVPPTISRPATPAAVSRPPPAIEEKHVTIAIMGATGSGKTTFINQASGFNLPVGHGLQSCTKVVQPAQPFKFQGCQVTLIDTPGFDDTTTSDTDILKMIGTYLANTYKGGKKLAGVVYLHRISDVHMGGTSTRNFKLFRELCGESTLNNVVIATNMWGLVDPAMAEAREIELQNEEMFFKPAIEKGATFVRHLNTVESAHSILRPLVGKQPQALQIQTEMVDQQKDIFQTTAGIELQREVLELTRGDQLECLAFKEEIAESVRMQEEETRQEIQEEQMQLHDDIIQAEHKNQSLAVEYSARNAELEQQLEEERKEAEQESMTQQEQIKQLQENLQQVTTTSAAETDRLQAQIAQMNRQVQEKHPQTQTQTQSGRTGAGYFGVYGAAIDSFVSSRSKSWW
uniref:G domain-containing protein n=1 Tax=Moniliophthora roreri TaxID=221103 RepID=A0A0W0EZU3_MONRR